MSRPLIATFSLLTALMAILVLGTAALAQEKPRHGGELVFVMYAEPPSFDGHRETTFGLMHAAAPHYSTLLRVDPFDKTGTKVVGDVAESWAISGDGLTYTFKLRRGVKFHDGVEITAQDVKATYDKIIFPPKDVVSARKASYAHVQSIETPDASTVVFKLRWATSSALAGFASPWNWLYKAEILAKDLHWYEKNIMGTGPFVFVEYVRGSHWLGKKNPNYWDKGKPYLDSYRGVVTIARSAQVSSIRSERAMIQFGSFAPAEVAQVTDALGSKAIVQEAPWNCVSLVAINHEKKPFNDKRVRRALTLALDRYQAAQALSRIAYVKEVAGVEVPGTPFATSPADLEKLAGYGRDIKRSRDEARMLLNEAGLGSGFSFTLKNRSIPMPYEPVGIWLTDQWRQIGVTVKHQPVESGAYFADLRGGNFEVAHDFRCGYIVEPDLDLAKFLSHENNSTNYSRYNDKVLDDLYKQQSRSTDPAERKSIIKAFERRLVDEEAHYLPVVQWHRFVPHSAKLKGYTVTPSNYLNQQLDTIWLAQ